MGTSLGSIFGRERYRILMLGLDNAGKTSIINQLRLNNLCSIKPTGISDVETVFLGDVEFVLWNVKGEKNVRSLWRHHYVGSQGLIFVVDSSDYERIDEARIELHKILNDREMRSISLLVLCNKQDIRRSMQPSEIQVALNLENLDRLFAIVPCSALNGTGIIEGFLWLSMNCDKNY